jgi:hypothetical protein
MHRLPAAKQRPLTTSLTLTLSLEGEGMAVMGSVEGEGEGWDSGDDRLVFRLSSLERPHDV